jgi:hypothetical protein
VGGAPSGAKRLNFDNVPLGSGTNTATGPNGSVLVSINPDAQVVIGSASGLYAAPWLSGGNGFGFGPGSTNQANGADATRYITTGDTNVPSGLVVLDFGSAASLNYFGILWGSIDGYNILRFYNGATLVDTVLGSQVIAAPNGNQGVNGTLYVNINTTSAYNRVELTSTSFAFEFDNVAYSGVPDGGMTLVLLGGALTGLGALRRKFRA